MNDVAGQAEPTRQDYFQTMTAGAQRRYQLTVILEVGEDGKRLCYMFHSKYR